MRIEKAKSPKPSMNCRVEARSVAALSRKHAAEPSASAMAEKFCDDMIHNLRHNVSESKKRLREAIQV
jgi:hypothetical protein